MKKKIEGQFRQGDVLVQRVNVTPGVEIERENGRIVLAHGEVTGHAHAIEEPDAALHEGKTHRVLRVRKAVALKHEEHAAITLKLGTYEVRRQMEYDPTEARRVAD